MTIGTVELDQMQKSYKAAVEEWIAAIKQEEALASVNHDVAEVDKWQAVHFREEDLRPGCEEAIRGCSSREILRILSLRPKNRPAGHRHLVAKTKRQARSLLLHACRYSPEGQAESR